MNENLKEILKEIAASYQSVLGENLVGIYIHGSIAFGCFNWDKSDIDFLVVTRQTPSLTEKEDLIRVLLELDSKVPQKGFEMSLMLESYCNPFLYPTPYELHFSNAYKERCHTDLEQYCASMNGVDKDLAAHVTVTREVGITLTGKPLLSVFGPVAHEYYLDSLKYDIADSVSDILENPVYIILNLCRVYAFLCDGLICSKADGGLWGLDHLPSYSDIISQALQCYRSEETFTIHDSEQLQQFAKEMIQKIFI